MAHRHDEHCCTGNLSTPSVHQTLDELEFERGIWSAALNGERDKINQHLAKGVNPNILDSSGYAPLHYASRNGHVEICKILLENGADPDICTKSGMSTSLHRSAMKGHIEIVNLLLSYRADPNKSDLDGKVALHKAADAGHVDVCEALVKVCTVSKDSLDNKNKKPIDYSGVEEESEVNFWILNWNLDENLGIIFFTSRSQK